MKITITKEEYVQLKAYFYWGITYLYNEGKIRSRKEFLLVNELVDKLNNTINSLYEER